MLVPPETTAWVKANAIPFTTPEAGHGFDDLRPLKKIVGDARIVSLGEPTHGTREAFQMKHRLLEFLVEEMGFSIFSIEANMPESYELNQYVIEGKGNPNKLIGGMYFWTWNTEEVLAMVEWMKDWNQKHPDKPRLQFTGFDMQTSTVAATLARDFIAANAPDLLEDAKTAFQHVESLKFGGMGGAGSFGVATGSFPVDAAKGKKLIYSGWIRTENLKDGRAGLWWRCDTANGVQGFENMQSTGPTGTTEWTRYEFTIDVPKETTNINFGVIMPGDGAAWFDDLQVTLDGIEYQSPDRMNLDFEKDPIGLNTRIAAGYDVKRVAEKPHGGEKCLEMRKKADAADKPKVDPADAEAAVRKVLDALIAKREDLASKITAKEADWAIQNTRVVAQCAHMYAAVNGSNARDEAMADNVEWILQQNPGAKIVLWAHNAHVSKGEIWGTKWMGSMLDRKFPGQMVVFGFATGSGQYTAVGDGGLKSDHILQTPPPSSVEAHLAAAKLPRLLLDIRGATPDDDASDWAATSRPMRSIGAMAMAEQFFPCVPKDLFDVLVYIDQTTAARQLSTKAGR
jgi:erythromycin esterase-like protein